MGAEGWRGGAHEGARSRRLRANVSRGRVPPAWNPVVRGRPSPAASRPHPFSASRRGHSAALHRRVFGAGEVDAPWSGQRRKGTSVTPPTRHLEAVTGRPAQRKLRLVLGFDRGALVVPEGVRLPHEEVAGHLFLVLSRQTAARGDKGGGVGRRGRRDVCADGAAAGGGGEDEQTELRGGCGPLGAGQAEPWEPGRGMESAEGSLSQLNPEGEQRLPFRGSRRERAATVAWPSAEFADSSSLRRDSSQQRVSPVISPRKELSSSSWNKASSRRQRHSAGPASRGTRCWRACSTRSSRAKSR